MSLAAAMSCYLQAHFLALCSLKGQYAAVNSCFCHTQKDADHFLWRFLPQTDALDRSFSRWMSENPDLKSQRSGFMSRSE